MQIESRAIWRYSYDARKWRNTYDASSAGDYISGLHQSGTSGFAAWLCVAFDVRGAWRAGVVRRRDIRHHIGGDHILQPAMRQADEAPRNRGAHGAERADDGGGAVRVFGQPLLRGALPLGHTLRAGRGERGRLAQQLCRPALREQAHELAALHVGAGSLRRTLCDGLRPVRRNGLERRLPVHSPVPGGAHRRIADKPALVEKTRRRSPGGGRRRRGGSVPAGNCPRERGEGDYGGVFLLLRNRADSRALGGQLSCAALGHGRRKGGLAGRHVLYRHNDWQGAERLPDHEAQRHRDGAPRPGAHIAGRGGDASPGRGRGGARAAACRAGLRACLPVDDTRHT